MNRNIYVDSASPYFRNRGNNAAELEREGREQRLRPMRAA